MQPLCTNLLQIFSTFFFKNKCFGDWMVNLNETERMNEN